MSTPYELERAANIAANEALLASLKISKPVAKPPSAKKPASKPAQRKSRKSEPIQPTRRSGRASAANKVIYNEDKLSRRPNRKGRSASPSLEQHRWLRNSASYSPEPATQQQTRSLNQMSPPPPAPEYYDDPTFTDFRPTFQDGYYHFEDGYEGFTPNLSPREIMETGSFAGGYWRSFPSKVVHRQLGDEDYKEFPNEWWEDLDADNLLTRPEPDYDANRYGVKAGQTIQEWEQAGWIRAQDPRGWMQWYFRFWMGRRSEDDARQIARWAGCAGPRGRFKTSLVTKITKSKNPTGWDDYSISPIVRQSLQHWAYKLSKEEFEAYTSTS